MALDHNEIKETLIDIIQQFTKASREELLHQQFSEAELDSLTIVEILFLIEDRFHIEIPDESAKNIDRFPALLATVEELIQSRSGG